MLSHATSTGPDGRILHLGGVLDELVTADTDIRPTRLAMLAPALDRSLAGSPGVRYFVDPIPFSRNGPGKRRCCRDSKLVPQVGLGCD